MHVFVLQLILVVARLCQATEHVIFVSPFPARRATSRRCGSSRDKPCSSIRSAIAVVPDDLDAGTTPVLQLLAGSYRGQDNVGMGDPTSTQFPSEAARGIVIRGETVSSLPDDTSKLRTQIPLPKDDEGAASSGDSNGVVIDCAGTSNATRGLYFMDGRITAGFDISVINCGGGGVLVSGSSATLRNIRVTGCGGAALANGGGLALRSEAAAVLESCVISGNEAREGGGMHVGSGSNATLMGGTVVDSNRAERGGGIALAEGARLSFSAATAAAAVVNAHLDSARRRGRARSDGATAVVRNNVAAAAGGGIWSRQAVLDAADLEVTANVAAGEGADCGDEGGCGGRGGGLSAFGGTITMHGGSFARNRANALRDRDDYARGGAVYARGAVLTFVGVTVEGNRAGAAASAKMGGAAGAGGGFYLDGTAADFAGCILRGNEAAASSLLSQLGAYGGGVVVRGPESIALFDETVFEANSARNGGSGGALWVGDGASAAVEMCNFTANRAFSSYSHRGGGGAVAASSTTSLNITASNFSANAATPEEPAMSRSAMRNHLAAAAPAAAAAADDGGGSRAKVSADLQCLSGEGGAILSSGAALHVSDAVFDGNKCEAGGLDTGCQGGAVSLSGRDTSGGGGSTTSGSTSGSGSSHQNGGSSSGGSHQSSNDIVVFERVSFHGNAALGSAGYGAFDGGGHGGAVAAKFVGAALFSACNFTENVVGGGGSGSIAGTGGAVFLFCCGAAPLRGGLGRSSCALRRRQSPDDDGVPTFSMCRFSRNVAGGELPTDLAGREPKRQLLGPVEASAGVGKAAAWSYRGMGGALSASGSSPKLRDCDFEANRAFAGDDARAAEFRVTSGAVQMTEATEVPPGVGGAMFLTPDCVGTDVSASSFAGNEAVGGSGSDLAVMGGRELRNSLFWPLRGAESQASDGVMPLLAGGATATLRDCVFTPTDNGNATGSFIFLASAGDVLLLRPSLLSDGTAYVADMRAHIEHFSDTNGREEAEAPSAPPQQDVKSHLVVSGDGGSAAGSLSFVISRGGALSIVSDDTTGPPPPLLDLTLLGGALQVVRAAGKEAPPIHELNFSGVARLFSGSVSAAVSTHSAVRTGEETFVQLRFWRETWLGPTEKKRTLPWGEEQQLRPIRRPWICPNASASTLSLSPAAFDLKFDGLELVIESRAHLSGKVLLTGESSSIAVAGAADLEVDGDAWVCYSAPPASPFARAGKAAHASVVNDGALRVAEGAHLTVTGGFFQSSGGRLDLPLPPPMLLLPEELDAPAPSPLTARGAVILAGYGAVSIPKSTGGGGSVQMHRKWAVAALGGGAGGTAKASDVDVSGLTMHGPPGVEMRTALAPDAELASALASDASSDFAAAAKAKRLAGSSSAAAAGWLLVAEAVAIDCSYMLHYGNVTASGGPCQTCLANPACAWCDNDVLTTPSGSGGGGASNNVIGGGGGGGCVPVSNAVATAPHSGREGGKSGNNARRNAIGRGRCRTGDCCPRSCSGTSRCDLMTGRCECGWFYAGSSCGDVSAAGAAALACGVATVLLAAAALLQARFLRPRQRLKELHGTLRELRQGLLEVHSGSDTDRHLFGMGSDDDGTSDGGASSKDGLIGGFNNPSNGSSGGPPPSMSRPRSAGAAAGGGGNGSGGGNGAEATAAVTRDYIEELQQDLALRDVLVPFSEVTLGQRVGGGAVGAVYRAVWRGAAVAVKMVRLPVITTDPATAAQEMERLKREAYLMSRLRHPNIVLILAISFLTQPLLPLNTTESGLGDPVSPKTLTPERLRELGFLPPADADAAAPLPPPGQTDRSARSRNRRRRSKAANSAGEASGVGTGESGGNAQQQLQQQALCVISEFMPNGSLEDAIDRGELDGAPYSLLLNIALQAARGMLYLHTHAPPICHRDLKGSNIVVGPGWQIKITDFGMSRFVPTSGAYATSAAACTAARWASPASSPVRYFSLSSGPGSGGRTTSGGGGGGGGRRGSGLAAAAVAAPQQLSMTSDVGTVAWAAPETFSESGAATYSLKVDSYSFGMVLLELSERRRPWGHLASRFDIIDAVLAGERPQISNALPRPWTSLIRRCWQHDPAMRPSFRDIVAILEEETERVSAQADPAAPPPAATAAAAAAAMPNASNGLWKEKDDVALG